MHICHNIFDRIKEKWVGEEVFVVDPTGQGSTHILGM